MAILETFKCGGCDGSGRYLEETAVFGNLAPAQRETDCYECDGQGDALRCAVCGELCNDDYGVTLCGCDDDAAFMDAAIVTVFPDGTARVEL